METTRGSLTLAAALVLCALPAGLAAQNRMEGVVTFKIEGEDGKKDTMTQTTRGRSMRLEGFGNKGGAWIYDADQKRMVMIDPEKKQAMVITDKDAAQARAMTQGMQQARGAKRATDKPAVHFAKTGKTETVAGVKCEVWKGYTEYEGKKREGEACLAEGVGFSPFDQMSSNPMFASESNEWRQYRDLVGPNKGIVKAVTIENGKARTAVEAIKVERKPISPAQFQPPAGYAVTDMGDMMRKAQIQMEQMKRQQGARKPPPQ
jgi:hypothetical protein